MLVTDAPKPVNKSDKATTNDLCLSNFLMLWEDLFPVFNPGCTREYYLYFQKEHHYQAAILK